MKFYYEKDAKIYKFNSIDESMYANKKRVYCVYDKSLDEGIIREEEGLYGEEGYWIEVCDEDSYIYSDIEQVF